MLNIYISGDCLLDSILQATWGVFDRDNVLRRALSESLSEASHMWVLKLFSIKNVFNYWIYWFVFQVRTNHTVK